jgi:carbamoyl-phosphate synthase/aspartate carbamoyltransferase/dihydroorotase
MPLIRLPGLLDAHVHLRDPGALAKEDFTTGTRAALAGGFVAVLDMPNNYGDPTVSPDALARKAARAAAAICCDVGLYYGATPDNALTYPQVRDSVCGLKAYLDQTTGTLTLGDLATIRAILAAWPADLPLVVHAEDRTLAMVLGLLAERPRRVHFAHVSEAVEIALIRDAKERGLPVTCEVAPHHLFLTEADVSRLGGWGVMKPPLRTGADVDALWANLAVVDLIATDHAPHTRAEKAGTPPPFGVPGLETALPLMLTAVADGRLSLDRLVELMATGPARVFGLPLAPTSTILVDPTDAWTFPDTGWQTKCDWSPFAGMRVRGRLRETVLRGQLAYRDGTVLAAPGSGRVLTQYATSDSRR